MSLSFAELLAQSQEAVIRELARTVKERGGPIYAAVPLEQLLPRMAAVFQAAHRAIAEENPAILGEFIQGTVRQRAAERYALEEVQTLISVLRELLLRLLGQAYRDEPDRRIASTAQLEELAHQARQQAFAVYLEVYEEEAERQRRALAELSTPVIKVYENILVLPLVGAIDTERSHRIMEELLLGITRHQAELLIIDITGVPVVDTAVANHLLQTIKAARLLGARSILVGISGEVAQALVHLQVDLSGVVTRANLQAGIEYALDTMGLEIAPRREAPPTEEEEGPPEPPSSPLAGRR